MSTLTIAWHGLDLNVDGYNIYRSDSPMDPNNLPSPIASVGPNIGSYDDNDVIDDNVYYYRIGTTKGGSETIGEEQLFNTIKFLLVIVTSDKKIIRIDSRGIRIKEAILPYDARDIRVDKMGNFCAVLNDNTIRKFDVNFNEIWSSYRYNDPITTITVDSDNGYIYVGFRVNGKIRRLNLTTGKEITSENWPFTDISRPVSIIIDSNGYIYSLDYYNYLKKFNSETGNEIWSKNVINDRAYTMAIDHNEEYLYFSDNQNDYIRKIDASNGDEITTDNWPVNKHESLVRRIVIDSNTGYIYSGSGDESIKKFEPITGQEVTSEEWPFTGHTNIVRAVALDSYGNVYSGSSDDKVKKIDMYGREIWSYELGSSSYKDFAFYEK